MKKKKKIFKKDLIFVTFFIENLRNGMFWQMVSFMPYVPLEQCFEKLKQYI